MTDPTPTPPNTPNNSTLFPDPTLDPDFIALVHILGTDKARRCIIDCARGLRQIAAGIGVIIGAVSKYYDVKV